MRFGIFYEHQLPRPWDEHSEYRLLHESLGAIELEQVDTSPDVLPRPQRKPIETHA